MDYCYIQKNKGVLSDDQWSRRISKCPIVCDDNILIEDRLEKGFIRIYEYTDGAVELPNGLYDMQGCMNAPLVAWMSVAVLPERKEVWLEDIGYNDGYDMYIALIEARVMHFVDFYDMKFCLLDLVKKDGLKAVGSVM